MTRSNYKPSKMDTIHHMIMIGESRYYQKCKERGIKVPTSFSTMMAGFTISILAVVGVIIWIAIR